VISLHYDNAFGFVMFRLIFCKVNEGE